MLAKQKHPTQARTRKVYAHGVLQTRRERRPCTGSIHAGPWVRATDPTPEIVSDWTSQGHPCPFVSNAWICRECGQVLQGLSSKPRAA